MVKVTDLIDHYNKTWDKTILSTHLSSIDVSKILSIPLSPTSTTNKLAWILITYGEFNVKRAY